jgi:uncharacterized protein
LSAAGIVESLAKELSIEQAHVQRVQELLSEGHRVPYITRYRRAEIGPLTDGVVRRLARRFKQFEELEKRRATLLRSIEEQQRSGTTPGSLEALRTCTDRFELEDQFLPHRRPEPEVQLAIDRGLEALADALVAPSAEAPAEAEDSAALDTGQPDAGSSPEAAESPAEASAESVASVEPPPASDEGSTEPSAEAAPVDVTEDVPADATGDATESVESASEPPAETESAEAAQGAEHEGQEKPASDGHAETAPRPAYHPARIDLSVQLARLCSQYVNTDRGVHSEEQALEGAMRILADRLGRNPELRTQLRRQLRKHGRVTVRPLVDESRLGRNRSLVRLNVPLKQLQGHRLVALRQAQSQRQIALMLTVDESHVLPRVRAALGKRIHPDHVSVADEIARQALHLRLLPMIEDDTRNELRDRADEEAIRMLAQHLRQILFTPPGGSHPAVGVHVDAKGDWVMVVVDADGQPRAEHRVEASSLTPADLPQRLGDALRDSGASILAIGHGKASRAAVQKLREAIVLLGAEARVMLVNEAGLSNYANSEVARQELPEHSVPAREAISLARRFQDPLQEFLKVDPRHLGLGREQAVVGKANLRRLVQETIESCVALVGCELDRAPVSFLRHVPGLNFDLARKLAERCRERPLESREALRTEGLLDDLAWRNAVGFLRLRGSSEPLDRTALHPEQYDLARRIIMQAGGSVEETLGRRDATRGLKRADFDVDEITWRDLVREIGHPGRDPRLRQFPPRFQAPTTEAASLAKDQVVEGVISNVTSFGAFVDIGLEKDAMIHIREFSSHYVRDARALVSVGQVVRTRVVDAAGPRIELSLKNVPSFRRGGGDRARQGGPRHERSGRGPRRSGGGSEVWPEYQPVLRAARTRRDGLVTGKSGDDRRGRGGGGRGGGRGPGRGSGRPGGGRRPEGREEYDADAVRRAASGGKGYNPFMTFFKGRDDTQEPPTQAESGGQEPADPAV